MVSAMRPRDPRWRTLAALAFALAGCRSSEDVELADRATLFPFVRTTIWNGERSATEVYDSALEIDLGHAAGKDRQSVGFGDEIDFDGTTFSGPVTVRNEADLLAGSATFRADFQSDGDRFAFGGAFLVGGGFTSLNLEVSSAALSERDMFTNFGPIVGGQFHLVPAPWIELRVRSTIQIGISDDPSVLTTLETGIEVEPHPSIGLFLGWRLWDYAKERKGSDIDVELSGPTFGLNFEF